MVWLSVALLFHMPFPQGGEEWHKKETKITTYFLFPTIIINPF